MSFIDIHIVGDWDPSSWNTRIGLSYTANTVAGDDPRTHGAMASSDKILTYRQTSNVTRTKSQNLNISRFVLQMSLPNPVKPGAKSKMKM